MTLGKRIDDKCRYYSKVDLTKMVIFDTVSYAYLEYKSDEYEELNFKKPRTYRFSSRLSRNRNKRYKRNI